MPPRRLLERPVIRIRAQQVEVRLRRVTLFPLISAKGGRLEPAGLLELTAVRRNVGGRRQAEVSAPWVPAPITVLDVDEERRIAAVDVVRGDGGEHAAGPGPVRRLAPAQ